MDALKIYGGATLSGDIFVSGSKNAGLPIICASLLAPGTSILRRVPNLADIKTLNTLLMSMGVEIKREGDALHLDATTITKPEAPYDLVRTMRASFLVLGPLLARVGHAKVSLPGGCAIGARPVDQHIKGLQKLGAHIVLEHGYVIAEAPNGLTGAEIIFDISTVTGTENLMLAAAGAHGTTVLRNCAREPEVTDLAEALIGMGVKISGVGTDCLEITGTQDLKPYNHSVMPDRIEFGTFLVAGALAGSKLRVKNGIPEHQSILIDKLRDIGTDIDVDAESGTVTLNRVHKPQPVHIETAPYPAFPTDMQAQLMTLLSLGEGESVISENIFENRFMHVAELARLGANIRVEGGMAFVHGVPYLSGSTVMATDLRASASLVLAGLVAQGETTVRRIYHLDRGYEHIEDKLAKIGARVERFKEL